MLLRSLSRTRTTWRLTCFVFGRTTYLRNCYKSPWHHQTPSSVTRSSYTASAYSIQCSSSVRSMVASVSTHRTHGATPTLVSASSSFQPSSQTTETITKQLYFTCSPKLTLVDALLTVSTKELLTPSLRTSLLTALKMKDTSSHKANKRHLRPLTTC